MAIIAMSDMIYPINAFFLVAPKAIASEIPLVFLLISKPTSITDKNQIPPIHPLSLITLPSIKKLKIRK